MWALVESNNITEVIESSKPMKIGGVQYPQNIFNMWSKSELEAIGIYEVVQDDTNKKDKEYYINTEQSFAFANNDWLVIRKEEAGTAIPSDWTTFRTGVRTTADSMKTKIDAVSDVDALAALYVYNDADPPVRPLGEFPTPPSS